jgi:hypothetical protein
MQKDLTLYQHLIPGASLNECRKISPSNMIFSLGADWLNAEKSHPPPAFDPWGQSE